MNELVPRLVALARQAKAFDLNFTVDAEEADRLELSLDVIAAAFADPSLAGWDGFGLAIQAYQKRAREVIDHVDDLARKLDRRMMLRLVKGAYWDTEIKRAQERGLDGYPVFTRKAMTDLNYVACAKKLLGLRPRIFPQFATHNALTVATILELAGDSGGFEFQRLHGMGEALYAQLSEDRPELAYRTYAPVGSHRDLLAYLVRRLLENGANSSFVALAADERVPIATLLRRPADIVGAANNAHHPDIAPPRGSLSAANAGIRAASSSANAPASTGCWPMSPPRSAREGSDRVRHDCAGGRGDGCSARRFCGVESHARRSARRDSGRCRRSSRATRRALHRAAAARRRQDAG